MISRFAILSAILLGVATAHAQPMLPGLPGRPQNPVANPAETPAVAQALNESADGPRNGIVAQVNSYIITMDDVLREIGSLSDTVKQQSQNDKDYLDKMQDLMDSTIQELIDQRLLIDEFRTPKEGQKDIPKIPDSFLKGAIDERIDQQFDGDRLKFHAWLQKRGQTPADFQREVEESVIVQYMQGQMNKSQTIVSPMKIEQYYADNKQTFFEPDKVKFRLLQINRNGMTDAELTAKAQGYIDRVKAGEKFEDIVKQNSDDLTSRAKGGENNTIAAGDLNPDFRRPVFEAKPGGLEAGEMTAPIIFNDAVYVLYVMERNHAGVQPIEKVRPQIEAILARQMTVMDTERHMERLRKNAFIKYF